MAAGPALEMWSKQNISASSPDGRVRNISITRAFTVTIAAADLPETAFGASGLPLVGDLYPGSNYVYCTKLDLQRTSPVMVIVTANYTGETGDNGPESSPIDNEVSITWSNATTDEEIDEDWNGRAIVTVNNEPIAGITERISDQVATIERNFMSINMYAIRAYLRSTNSDTFLDWPPGTCRMMSYSASKIFTGGNPTFWKVSATFQFREPYRTTPAKAWYKRVRNEGFLVRDTPSDEPHIAWDLGTKSPVTKPILLKANGLRETDPDNAHWLEFRTLGSLPYSGLGLTS